MLPYTDKDIHSQSNDPLSINNDHPLKISLLSLNQYNSQLEIPPSDSNLQDYIGVALYVYCPERMSKFKVDGPLDTLWWNIRILFMVKIL